jgi:hypothetical protein
VTPTLGSLRPRTKFDQLLIGHEAQTFAQLLQLDFARFEMRLTLPVLPAEVRRVLYTLARIVTESYRCGGILTRLEDQTSLLKIRRRMIFQVTCLETTFLVNTSQLAGLDGCLGSPQDNDRLTRSKVRRVGVRPVPPSPKPNGEKR